ncbi:hypothetical protein J7E97_02725 [Streptomyces sp. ISL-66]|uniref:HEAT repeat domain-containing protein n=1 Tax=Streptomyces sp. ISL-66 TaxID=2819186 RepID=UPI001BEB32D7|nr:HEAT repeat domain-containing protein [Streptomyces sp. ISL-66]MBT2466808.1 hypothetical protein [Streptomyces sp. ISL-66]
MHTGRGQRETHAGRAADAGRDAVGRLVAAEGTDTEALPPDAGPAAWISFDEAVRDSWPGSRDIPHVALRLCHRDGWIRAAALEHPHSPLPLVAIRCTDWVPAVREHARKVLTTALAADPTGTLRLLTPLVLRLARREQGAWALEVFSAVLRGEQVPVATSWWRLGPSPVARDAAMEPVLAALRDSDDLPTRRFATRISLEGGGLAVRELAGRARAELDPVTSRIWTDAALAAMAADGADDAAVDELLAGRLPLVRAAGVTALRRAGRAAEAPRYLTDRSSLVRACARWLVSQDGGDPRALSRALLEDPARVTPYAVTGFAECARREDAPLLRALLDHPAGAVRASAVRGLRLLDSTDVGPLRALLDDPSPSVAREASLSLRSSAGRLPTDWLVDRLAPGRPVHIRRAAYRLLHAQGGVAGLRASVELLTDQDAGLRRLASQYIQSLRSPYGPPALPPRDPEVGTLLDRCTGLFSDYVLACIRSQLGLPRGESTTDGY